MVSDLGLSGCKAWISFFAFGQSLRGLFVRFLKAPKPKSLNAKPPNADCLADIKKELTKKSLPMASLEALFIATVCGTSDLFRALRTAKIQESNPAS